LILAFAAICAVTLMAGCAGAASRAAAGRIASAGKSTAPPTAAAPATTYVAIGASDAFGIGTDDPAYDNWPTLLVADLGGHMHVVNLGIPGATLAQAIRDELPVALDGHPEIVTVWLAVNDLADGVALNEYSTLLTTLLTQLRTQTHARVYVGNVPDLTLLPYFRDQDPDALRARIGQWNVVIAASCAATGAHLVDLSAYSAQLAQHPDYVASDGLHPSTLGADALAQAFAKVIKPIPSP
jgi:acyl-CoA thioesterase I